jgi:hypothetical protein
MLIKIEVNMQLSVYHFTTFTTKCTPSARRADLSAVLTASIWRVKPVKVACKEHEQNNE